MVKGISTGIVSGGFVGVVVMSMLSLYAPLPQDKIDAAPKLAVETQAPEAVPATQGQSSAAAPAPEAPVVPSTTAGETTEMPVTSGETTAPADQTDDVALPEQDAPVVQPETPQLDSSSATQSESPSAEIASSDATLVRPVPDAPTVASQSDDPIVIARADPAPQPATQVDTGVQAPAADTSPSVASSTSSQAPKIQPSQLPEPTVVGTEQPAAPAAPSASAGGRSLPTIGADPVTSPLETAAADTPITLPQIDAGVVTNRLPSVGGSGGNSLIQTEPTETATAPAATQEPADLGALRQFSARVEGTEGKSLFGLILIDSGEDGIPREDLMKLSVPATIAIDPTQPNAAQIMQDYRAAGMEVVAIANELPVSAAPGDVATAVAAYFNILDQSIGLMDPLDGRIQSNRSLLQPVLGAIRASGHGLVTYDRGLNTAQQAARREDIPAATVFRVLDADLESSPKIKRYLDRAAFNANRDGSVVVVGRSYPDTVKAVVEWVLEKKEAGIAMVPVSAVMLAGEGS